MRIAVAVCIAGFVGVLTGASYQMGVATAHATPDHGSSLQPGVTPAVKPTPLILSVDEGEARVRRFAVSAPKFILKVDARNGGSGDLVMGYEDLPPGGSIPPHWHKMADEILFVHRGSGVVDLGDRQRPVSAGATIYIPKDVRVTLRNTGTEPLSIAFIFSKPGFDMFLREMSAPEGQPFEPLSEADLRAIRKRHEWHTVYERP